MVSEVELRHIIDRFREDGSFVAQEIELDDETADKFVRLRSNPPRFLRSIFDGDWASAKDKPAAGTIRLLRVIAGRDGVYRAIGRQGTSLYAYPWF